MTDEPKRSPRPWLKVLLVVSLAVNLAVAGLGIGAAWRFRDFPPAGEGPPMLGRFVFKDLGRKEIHRLLRDGSDQMPGARDRRRDEMTQVIALMRAETLDVAAMHGILESHVVETSAFMRSVVEAWEQRLAGLSLKQRQALADRMQHQVDHGHHRGKDRRDDD